MIFYVCACTYVRFYVIFHFVVVEVPIMYDSTKKCTLRPKSRVKAHTYSNKIGGVSCLLMFFMRLGKTTQFFGSSIYVGTKYSVENGQAKTWERE